jgi:hypothetical protein
MSAALRMPQKKGFWGFVNNVLSMRKRWLQTWSDDRRRNIEDECGHPQLDEIQFEPEKYWVMHCRDPIANRVNSIFAKQSWQVRPEIYEDENPDTETAFEKSWQEVLNKFTGGRYHKNPNYSLLWDYTKRFDIASGIAHYGVMLIGLDDGKKLSQPAEFLSEGESISKPERRITYLRVFPEHLCEVIDYEEDTRSERYGQPTKYNLKLIDPRSIGNDRGHTEDTLEVHWTRVLHLAHNCEAQDTFGLPNTLCVWNRLLDSKKLYGGSAEMYWKGALPGLFLGTDPALGGDVDIDDPELAREEVEQYQNGLQRILMMVGFKPEQLAPTVVDPTPQIERQVEAICIAMGVPKRIFMGSERGELASSQDDAEWNDTLRSRQYDFNTPRVVAPMVERFILMKALATPKESFQVFWPDMTFQLTQALAQYITSMAYHLMSPMDYFVNVWGMPEKTVKSILENTKKSDEFKKALAMHAEAKAEMSMNPLDKGGSRLQKRKDSRKKMQGRFSDNGKSSKTKKLTGGK